MIRISGGKYKNIFLEVAKDISRPLTERIRLSIFEILKPYLQDATILDLYAGSGVTGLESLSRGARSCMFVDLSYKAGEVIRQNISKLNDLEETKIKIQNVFKFLKQEETKYDIIFLDPPFKNQAKIDIDILHKNTHENSIIVLRTSSNTYLKQNKNIIADKFEEKYSKKYSQSQVVFYRPKL